MANVQHSGLTGTDLHEPKAIAAAGANRVYLSDGAGSGSWTSARDHIDSNQNAKVVQVTVLFSDVDAGGSKLVLAPGTGTGRIHIRDILVYRKTAWTGTGADRSLIMTDGTSTWFSIPHAGLVASPSFIRWFDTDLPGPAVTDDFRTASQAGVNITIKYSGGTTDDTAGEYTFVIFYERTTL